MDNFETFYSENYKELLRHLRYSHLSKEDAEDLAQDIFLELLQKKNLDESHLWKLTKSRLCDFFRDKTRREQREKKFAELLKEFFKNLKER